MHGNLEPDEDIMSDRNWVTETVMTVPEWTGDILKALSQLGWEPDDKIDVEKSLDPEKTETNREE